MFELSSDQVKALQDIVGPEYVAVDPWMRDAYAIWYNSSRMNQEGKNWAPRGAAVVLPKTPEEISEITKFCNENDFMVKPFSTGMVTSSAAGSPRTILLDLKRMNRIVELDIKNQTVVLEPYVKAINLQSVLWREGLNTAVVSCGGQHSPLASTTAGWGYGLTGPSCGHTGRNMLGLEWVMPSGEMIRLGSAGEGAGWFSTAGPGPDLQGLIRGYVGTFGGLGTYTKCAVKCTRWDGPKEIRVDGANPRYELKDELPSNVGVFMLAFGSKEAMADAGYKLGEADISYADFRLPAFFTALYNTNSNLEFIPVWKSGIFQMLTKYSLQIAVVGYSQAEYDWKVKALKEILKEVGGLRLPLTAMPPMLMKALEALFKVVNPMEFAKKVGAVQKMIDLLPSNKEAEKKIISNLFLLLCRHANNAQGSFRPSSGMGTTVGSLDTWDSGIAQNNLTITAKEPRIKEGAIVDDGGDLGCGGTYEAGHLGYLEGIVLYNPQNPQSIEAYKNIVEGTTIEGIKKGYSTPLGGFGPVANSTLGPHHYNYHLWIQKIKQALDPNDAADSWSYSEPTKPVSEEEAKMIGCLSGL